MTVLSQMQAGLRTSLDPEMPQGSPSGARTQPRGGGGLEAVASPGSSHHRPLPRPPARPVLVALSPWKPHRGWDLRVCAGGSSSRPDTTSALGQGPWSERVGQPGGGARRGKGAALSMFLSQGPSAALLGLGGCRRACIGRRRPFWIFLDRRGRGPPPPPHHSLHTFPNPS